MNCRLVEAPSGLVVVGSREYTVHVRPPLLVRTKRYATSMRPLPFPPGGNEIVPMSAHPWVASRNDIPKMASFVQNPDVPPLPTHGWPLMGSVRTDHDRPPSDVTASML